MFHYSHLKKPLIVFLVLLAIISCSTTTREGSTRSSRNNNKKSSMPKVPKMQIPGGTGDNWRYLGTTKDKLIAIEINESSITNNGSFSKFQDRKTIFDQKQFDYQNLTPSYKYSLSWWQLDCNQKQYLISETSIYDVYGNLIKKYNFSNQDLTWSSVTSGSIAKAQYEYVCNGVNRGLGY